MTLGTRVLTREPSGVLFAAGDLRVEPSRLLRFVAEVAAVWGRRLVQSPTHRQVELCLVHGLQEA